MRALARRFNPRRWSRGLCLTIALVAALVTLATQGIAPLLRRWDDHGIDVRHRAVVLPRTRLRLPPLQPGLRVWLSHDWLDVDPRDWVAALPTPTRDHLFGTIDPLWREALTYQSPNLGRLTAGRVSAMQRHADAGAFRSRSLEIIQRVSRAMDATLEVESPALTHARFTQHWLVDARLPMDTVYSFLVSAPTAPTFVVEGPDGLAALHHDPGVCGPIPLVALTVTLTEHRVAWRTEPEGCSPRAGTIPPRDHVHVLPRTGNDHGTAALQAFLATLPWALPRRAESPPEDALAMLMRPKPFGLIRVAVDARVTYGAFVETLLAARETAGGEPLFPSYHLMGGAMPR